MTTPNHTSDALRPEPKIQRWDIIEGDNCEFECRAGMAKLSDGEYILFDDHEAAIAVKDRRIRELEQLLSGKGEPQSSAT